MDFVVIAGHIGVAADELVVDQLVIGATLADNEIGLGGIGLGAMNIFIFLWFCRLRVRA